MTELADVYARLEPLDAIQKEIVGLSEVSGLSLDEIATELDLPLEVIAREWGRAIAKLTGCELLYVNDRDRRAA